MNEQNNETQDWGEILKIFNGDAPQLTPKQKAERRAEWEKFGEELRKSRERRQKIAEALWAEEKRTGWEIPMLLRMRFGLIHVLFAPDQTPPDTSEKPGEPPIMTYYRRYEENLRRTLLALDEEKDP